MEVAHQQGHKSLCLHTCVHLQGRMGDGALPVLLVGHQRLSRVQRAAVHTHELPPESPPESHGNLPFFPLTLIKFPGLKPSSNFLSTCASHPCLSCFFPILSIRGSPQFKNGNETWHLYLYPLLASSMAMPHTRHCRPPWRPPAARHCSQPADLEPMQISCLKLDLIF